MTSLKELEAKVECYRAEEINIAQALRESIAPIWIDAYGSLQNRDTKSLTFEAYIAGVLDILPMDSNRPSDR